MQTLQLGKQIQKRPYEGSAFIGASITRYHPNASLIDQAYYSYPYTLRHRFIILLLSSKLAKDYKKSPYPAAPDRGVNNAVPPYIVLFGQTLNAGYATGYLKFHLWNSRVSYSVQCTPPRTNRRLSVVGTKPFCLGHHFLSLFGYEDIMHKKSNLVNILIEKFLYICPFNKDFLNFKFYSSVKFSH